MKILINPTLKEEVYMKKIGVIPARMAASRFPGKPLYPILGMPMI